MPKRKIKRTLEEEEKFKQQRRERNAENQRRRRHNAKTLRNMSKSIDINISTHCIDGTICDNRIIELNDNVEDNLTNNILLQQQSVRISGTIRDNRIIELDTEVIGESSIDTTSTCQQHSIESRQSRYQSRQKNQPRLNSSDSILMNDVIGHYIGPMDVYCIHCNAKHRS